MSTTPTIASTTVSGADPILTLITLIQFCIGLPGLIVNGFLVFVIFKNKQLRTGCCSILILLLAISDCLSELTQITVSTVFYLNNITIPLLTCFYIGVFGAYAQQNVNALLLLIGVDRLLSIIFPLIYKNLSNSNDHKWKCYYMFILLAVPSVPIFFTNYNYYVHSTANSIKQVFCFPTDFFGQVGIEYTYLLKMICNVGTFIVYSKIWLLIRLKIVKLVQNSVEQRVLRSLYILILVTFFCWLPPIVFSNFVLPHISPDFQAQLTVTRMLALLSKLAQALNGVILYVSSLEYRSAMQREFRWIVKFFKRNNQISNTSSNNINNNNINVVSRADNLPSRMHQRVCSTFKRN